MDKITESNASFLDARTCLVGAVTFLVAYLLTYRRDRGYKNLPPSPPVLPFVGNAYLFGRPSVEKLADIARKGNKTAVRIYAGPVRAVVLSSYEAIREAAIDKAHIFSDRGTERSFCFTTINPNLKGIINGNFHETLRANRSSVLTIFRNLGVGRTTMEQRIQEEARETVEEFAKQKQQAFDPWHIINVSVSNVILYVTFNRRHEHTDPELLKIVDCTNRFVKSGAQQSILDAIPFLRHIPPFKKAYDNFVESDENMRDFMWKYAEPRIANFDLNSDSNFIDCWMQKNFDESANRPVFDKEELLFILRDFLVAGSETTTTSIRWTLLFLANRPEMQNKAYEEIARVVGHDRQVSLNDRKHLPYIEAIILEIQRFNTIVPRAIPHYTNVDTEIGGYTIPAKSIVIFNLHAVHRNPDVFADPDEFRPDRFIDENGKFVKHPHVIPFSIGKRSCLGEILAVQELFLFTASLLQNFQFLPPPGCDKIPEEGVFGFTYGPQPFTVRAVPRV